MIDFNNASFLKLRPAKNETFYSMISELLIDGEQVLQSFQNRCV